MIIKINDFIHVDWNESLTAMGLLIYLLPDNRIKADHTKVVFLSQVCI